MPDATSVQAGSSEKGKKHGGESLAGSGARKRHDDNNFRDSIVDQRWRDGRSTKRSCVAMKPAHETFRRLRFAVRGSRSVRGFLVATSSDRYCLIPPAPLIRCGTGPASAIIGHAQSPASWAPSRADAPRFDATSLRREDGVDGRHSTFRTHYDGQGARASVESRHSAATAARHTDARKRYSSLSSIERWWTVYRTTTRRIRTTPASPTVSRRRHRSGYR